MKVNYEVISELEENLVRLEIVADTIKALSIACSEGSCYFPSQALVLPTYELEKIYEEYKRIVEILTSKKEAA